MRVVFGLILVILGLSFFADIPIFHFFVALVIIAIGWKVLTGEGHHRGGRHARYHHMGHHATIEHDLDEVRVFGEVKKRVESSDFESGRVIVVMGGSDIDLSTVKTSQKEVYLELVAVLGGIKIKIPKNWKVVNKSTAVAGGIDDNTSGSGNVVLKISGATVLGGIEIVS